MAFADRVRALVQAYNLNGFDIDFESKTIEEQDMLTLAQEIRRSLNKIPSTRPMIMTIAPDQTGGLNKDVLEQFTYVMAQTYDHACSDFSFDDKVACRATQSKVGFTTAVSPLVTAKFPVNIPKAGFEMA